VNQWHISLAFGALCLLGVVVKQLHGCQVSLTSRCPDSATVWKSLEMPYRNVRTVSRMASEEYYLRNIDVPAGEDHEALNLPLGCSRLPTNASFKCSQYARGYNRQTRDTSGSH